MASDGTLVCIMGVMSRVADAKLIEAAPDLLASLKELRNPSYGNPSAPNLNELIDRLADAAIAKAEGR